MKKRQQTAIDANNKAVALGRAGNFAAAIQQHELAVQNDPTNKQFRINLSAAECGYGQQRLAQSDIMGAASCLRKALSAAPDNGLAGKLLADCMKKMGRDPGSADVRLA